MARNSASEMMLQPPQTNTVSPAPIGSPAYNPLPAIVEAPPRKRGRSSLWPCLQIGVGADTLSGASRGGPQHVANCDWPTRCCRRALGRSAAAAPPMRLWPPRRDPDRGSPAESRRRRQQQPSWIPACGRSRSPARRSWPYPGSEVAIQQVLPLVGAPVARVRVPQGLVIGVVRSDKFRGCGEAHTGVNQVAGARAGVFPLSAE
jgi:hypothetical protein